MKNNIPDCKQLCLNNSRLSYGMVFGVHKLLFSFFVITVLFSFSALAQVLPLQGTFTQNGPTTCAPTALGVLADTTDITPLPARAISARIISACNATINTGISLTEGVWGLIRGVLNRTGGTTPGSNITITINSRSSAITNTINLTNGSSVTLIFTGSVMNASILNTTLGGASSSGGHGASTSAGGGKPAAGCGGTCGGRPVVVGYKEKGPDIGHAVDIVGINFNEPSNHHFGPWGTHPAYAVVYWDPRDNRHHTGWLSSDGEYFDDGMNSGKTTEYVSM